MAMTRLLSGETVTPAINAFAGHEPRSSSVLASNMRTSLRGDPAASNRPSGEKLTPLIACCWPNVLTSLPSATFHIRASGCVPATIRRPS